MPTPKKLPQRLSLAYGLTSALPPGAKAAWGCRAIATNDTLDFVFNRQDAAGETDEARDEFLKYINGIDLNAKLRETFERLASVGAMRGDQMRDMVLYEDDTAMAIGNTMASYGYCYIVAYQKTPKTTQFLWKSQWPEGMIYGIVDTPRRTGTQPNPYNPEETVENVTLTALTKEVTGFWSNATFLPGIGERVQVNMNGLGAGEVVAYFKERQWIGVEVALDQQPDWHLKQTGRGSHALVFGIEVAPEKQ